MKKSEKLAMIKDIQCMVNENVCNIFADYEYHFDKPIDWDNDTDSVVIIDHMEKIVAQVIFNVIEKHLIQGGN